MEFGTATVCDNWLLCWIALPPREHSLKDQVHSFFAVLPLKRQRSSQHLKLGDRTYKCKSICTCIQYICAAEYLCYFVLYIAVRALA